MDVDAINLVCCFSFRLKQVFANETATQRKLCSFQFKRSQNWPKNCSPATFNKDVLKSENTLCISFFIKPLTQYVHFH